MLRVLRPALPRLGALPRGPPIQPAGTKDPSEPHHRSTCASGDGEESGNCRQWIS